MTQFYVDGEGHYFGGFDGIEPPEGSIEVALPPDDARMRWNGEGYDPVLPAISDYQSAIQSLVDEAARAKQFNDGVTMASYVASTVEPWAVQAQAFVAWRDDVWQYAYSELAKVQGGVRPQPTVEGFLAELPEIIWPVALAA